MKRCLYISLIWIAQITLKKKTTIAIFYRTRIIKVRPMLNLVCSAYPMINHQHKRSGL